MPRHLKYRPGFVTSINFRWQVCGIEMKSRISYSSRPHRYSRIIPFRSSEETPNFEKSLAAPKNRITGDEVWFIFDMGSRRCLLDDPGLKGDTRVLHLIPLDTRNVFKKVRFLDFLPLTELDTFLWLLA